MAEVGEDEARRLATESRAARLASGYRPRAVGEGCIELSALALGAARSSVRRRADDGVGLRVWIGDDAFELLPVES